jgi:hypothetical protein
MLLLAACATAPVQEMSDARQAIRSAEAAGAAQRSSGTFSTALRLLQEAQTRLEAGAYANARQLALDARDEADQSAGASGTPPTAAPLIRLPTTRRADTLEHAPSPLPFPPWPAFRAALLALLVAGDQPANAQSVNFTLPDLGDRPVQLADFRGRWVIVNFWASWCSPCLLEMPELQAFHRSAPRPRRGHRRQFRGACRQRSPALLARGWASLFPSR